MYNHKIQKTFQPVTALLSKEIYILFDSLDLPTATGKRVIVIIHFRSEALYLSEDPSPPARDPYEPHQPRVHLNGEYHQQHYYVCCFFRCYIKETHLAPCRETGSEIACRISSICRMPCFSSSHITRVCVISPFLCSVIRSVQISGLSIQCL